MCDLVDMYSTFLLTYSTYCTLHICDCDNCDRLELHAVVLTDANKRTLLVAIIVQQ